MNIYFEDIRIINPSDKIDSRKNIWIKNGIIEYIGHEKPEINDNTEIIQGHDLVVAPGFFDLHVHFRDPGFEQKEDVISGCLSAANGGFTGVMMMPNTSPCIDDITVLHYLKNISKDNIIDVEISSAITKGREGKLLSPMLELHENGVKLFTDDGTCLTSPDIMRRAFEYASVKDLLISQHCEEHALTEGAAMNESKLSYTLGLKGFPNIAEDMIVARDIMLSEHCGNRRYHAQHISTKGSVEIIRQAKAKGLRITAEVTPHHLFLTENVMDSYDSNYKMCPPLRSEADRLELITGIIDGTIDCIATDHAPHTLNEKDVPLEAAPNGILGLETAIGVVMTELHHKNGIPLNKIVEVMSVNPRNLIGLPIIKIEQGVQANLTIIYPEKKWVSNKNNLKSKSINTPFDNYEFTGKPFCVINNGQIFKSEL